VTILVDGIQTVNMNMPISAVRRILVNKNPYSAEYRRPGKARIEVITQDGSRRHYHGLSGYSFGNTAWDARAAFAPDKPNAERHRFEESFGGPLGGQHASFYGSFERLEDARHNIVNAVTPDGNLNITFPRYGHSNLSVSRIDLRPGDATRPRPGVQHPGQPGRVPVRREHRRERRAGE
jgi:hypothetical protein